LARRKGKPLEKRKRVFSSRGGENVKDLESDIGGVKTCNLKMGEYFQEKLYDRGVKYRVEEGYMERGLRKRRLQKRGELIGEGVRLGHPLNTTGGRKA